MKRLLMFVLAVIFCFGFWGCFENEKPEPTPDNTPKENPKQEDPKTPREPLSFPATPDSLEEFQSAYLNFLDEVPKIYINTADGAEVEGNEDEDYIDATVSVDSENPEYDITDWQARVRGRGNSTWKDIQEKSTPGFFKKSYRLKGINDQVSMLGLPANKDWILIANQTDKTLMRNYIGLLLGRSLETQIFNPNVIFIDVYFNGRYDGVYTLHEHVEAAKNRVDVEGFVKDAGGNIVDVGFLVELDWKERNPGAVEDRDFFRIGSKQFFLKYPRYDDEGFIDNPSLFQQAFNYVKNYIISADSAIESRNENRFEDLCDRASFIDHYLVDELVKDVDGQKLSVFFSKKIGGKMMLSPLWDFDITMGNCEMPEWKVTWLDEPEGWNVFKPTGGNMINWIYNLLRIESFYEDLRSRMIDLHAKNIKFTIESIDTVKEFLEPAAQANFERWQILDADVYIWPNPPAVQEITTYEGQVNFLKDFLTQRSNWIHEQLRDRNPLP